MFISVLNLYKKNFVCSFIYLYTDLILNNNRRENAILDLKKSLCVCELFLEILNSPFRSSFLP